MKIYNYIAYALQLKIILKLPNKIHKKNNKKKNLIFCSTKNINVGIWKLFIAL